MIKIYQNARRVIAWIGDYYDNDELRIRQLFQLIRLASPSRVHSDSQQERKLRRHLPQLFNVKRPRDSVPRIMDGRIGGSLEMI